MRSYNAGRQPWIVGATRVVRAIALLAALASDYVFSTLDHRLLGAITGLGVGYVVFTATLGSSAHVKPLWNRARLAFDALLIACLAALDSDGWSSPLLLLFVLPVCEAGFTMAAEELLIATLLVVAGSGALALHNALEVGAVDRRAAWAFSGLLMLLGVVLLQLVREMRHWRGRDRRLHRLESQHQATARIGEAMHQKAGQPALAELLLAAAIDLTGCHAASLALLDREGESLVPVPGGTRGPDPPALATTPAAELAGADLIRLRAAENGFGTILDVLLKGDAQRLVGRLALHDPRPPEGIAAEELEALGGLAWQAGVAFEQARLREGLDERDAALVKRVSELSALFEVSRALVALDRHGVLDEILTRAMQMVDAERGSLMLLEDGADTLSIVTAKGLPREIVEGTRVALGEGFAGQVAATGQSLRLLDTLEEGEARAEIRDALCVPLKVQGRVIGVLNVSNKTGPDVFTQYDLEFLSALGNQAAIGVQNARLLEDLQELFLSTISSLAIAVDAKDAYTAGHSHRVTFYALEIARELGMPAEEEDLLRVAGLMHDIGKIGVPESILRKPGPLEGAELDVMREHPMRGARIVEPIRQLGPILSGVRWHHEWHNGSGYPDGLVGDQIPFYARVLAVADAWDAMTSDRPYRKALPDDVALARLRDGAGTQWNPAVVAAFEAAYDGRVPGSPDPDPSPPGRGLG
ncbi:MAG: GAF domain-containing protein [Armatimonadetes bacterium]|nr:GAF domain-containing protein [Armatimonadota bacterium]